MLIYILEDDDNIREIERYALQNNGYDVMDFSAPHAFYAALEKQRADLIILDIMLPEQDGLTVLSSLRENARYARIPVIIISARTTELDSVKGLDIGADDYLCKPFGVMELVSRVKARLRSANHAANYSCAGITLSENDRSVFVGEQKTELTYKEFELLKLLISAPGKVFTREEILKSVWGYDSDLGRTLDIHINTLRKKLKEKGSCIVTLRNVGYKLEKD
jgi:two-component system alkaline phosphatase synthesis response regulator PhoP